MLYTMTMYTKKVREKHRKAVGEWLVLIHYLSILEFTLSKNTI